MIYRDWTGSGYKYDLHEWEMTILKNDFPDTDPDYPWCWIKNGVLLLPKGYAWNGATGPTRQDSKNKRGSAVHDGLYQLLRKDLLPMSYREAADEEFILICKQDGMGDFRAWCYMKAVRIFGSFTSKLSDKPRYKIVDTELT